jgi:selenoprotein W-related protein
MKPRAEIRYCVKCRWLLRASWLAQELLSTFEDDLGEVALVPGDVGVFEVRVAEAIVWERKRDRGFPDAAELKRRVRDVLAPERDLGHVDRSSGPTAPGGDPRAQ